MTKSEELDALLKVIRVWMETESGPTKMTFSHPNLHVQVAVHGYKKLILTRTFGAESPRTQEG